MAARFECSDSFVDTLRTLDDQKKRMVAAYLKEILVIGGGPAPHIRELPPMHKPGTMQAHCGEFLIRYIVRYENDEGVMVRFFKLIDRAKLYR